MIVEKIKLAIVGVGNCASSLVQGIYFYKDKTSEEAIGLMHWDIGGYKPNDIDVVAAFDIDRRKVGQDVSQAIFAEPNCTTVFCEDIPEIGTKVSMGRILDGVSEHLVNYEDKYTFIPSDAPEPTRDDVIAILKESGAQVLVNYLPVGSEEATSFYAECCLEAGVAFVNCIPVFIASNQLWADKFESRNIPIVGDDIKSQLGATIVHRMITDLAKKRGVKIERTYQLNTAGNTDFLNMLNRTRLKSKKESKTEAVQSVCETRLEDEDIHVGPSDYVPWQKDNKVCFIRVEGKLFGDVPMNIEMRLSVEDSPNSAGVAIDAIRCCKLALDRGKGGVLFSPSSYFMKHPPKQYPDGDAYRMTEEFINGFREY
nr:inositol-3-phosphate synthase [Laspinema sp. D3b]